MMRRGSVGCGVSWLAEGGGGKRERQGDKERGRGSALPYFRVGQFFLDALVHRHFVGRRGETGFGHQPREFGLELADVSRELWNTDEIVALAGIIFQIVELRHMFV